MPPILHGTTRHAPAKTDSHLITYLPVSPVRLWRHRLGMLLLASPALALGAFTAVYLFPRVHMNWQRTGMGEAPQWLLEIPATIFESLFRYGQYALLIIVAAMALFDSRATNWSRYRYLPFGVIAFSVNFAVLLGITFTCLAYALVVSALP